MKCDFFSFVINISWDTGDGPHWDTGDGPHWDTGDGPHGTLGTVLIVPLDYSTPVPLSWWQYPRPLVMMTVPPSPCHLDNSNPIPFSSNFDANWNISENEKNRPPRSPPRTKRTVPKKTKKEQRLLFFI